jgi:hypothetical protein
MLLQQFNPGKNQIIIWWKELAIAVFCVVALGFGMAPAFLNSAPTDTLFFELYFKDIFLVVVIGCIFWFIQLLKPKPERLQEFFFLNSLPVKSKQLALHFLLKELLQNSWLPALTSVLFFSLLVAAPVAHILRIGFFIFLLYSMLTTLNSAIHFVSAQKKFNPLSTLNPIFVFCAAFLFLVFTSWAALVDQIFSGYSFLLLVLIMMTAQATLILFHLRAFKKWRSANRIFNIHAVSSPKTRRSFWHTRQWRMSPILLKNMLKIEREKSLFVLLLTATFVTCGYLVSRNNQRVDDFLAIMQTVLLMYAIIFSYRSQNILSTASESTQTIFSLPIRRLELYASSLLPLLLWMFLINTIFFLLSLTANISLEQGLLFWFKSFSLCGGLVLVAFNFSFAAYPNTKAAQTSFLYWGLVYLVLMALFFKYWYPIFLIMVGLSFLKLIKKKLYRVV